MRSFATLRMTDAGAGDLTERFECQQLRSQKCDLKMGARRRGTIGSRGPTIGRPKSRFRESKFVRPNRSLVTNIRLLALYEGSLAVARRFASGCAAIAFDRILCSHMKLRFSLALLAACSSRLRFTVQSPHPRLRSTNWSPRIWRRKAARPRSRRSRRSASKAGCWSIKDSSN